MRFLALALLSVMLFVSGCGSTAEKEQKKEITIGMMPDTDSLPFIVAEKEGYFEAEGVKVNLVQFKSAMDRDAALQSGNLDGAVSDVLAAAFLKSGGFPVVITSRTDGSYKLIAGKNAGARGVPDLAGKEIAVSKNTIIEYVTDSIFAKENLGEAAIEKVVIPQIPTRLEMLQNGKLAAATLPEPMATMAIASGGVLVSSSDHLGINPGIILFTEQATKDKKKDIQAMYRAYNRAVAKINEQGKGDIIDLAIEKLAYPPKVKEVLVLPKYREAALPEKSDITDCVLWLNRKELVKDSYTYESLVVDLLPH